MAFFFMLYGAILPYGVSLGRAHRCGRSSGPKDWPSSSRKVFKLDIVVISHRSETFYARLGILSDPVPIY